VHIIIVALDKCVDVTCGTSADCAVIAEVETCFCRQGFQFEPNSTTSCQGI